MRFKNPNSWNRAGPCVRQLYRELKSQGLLFRPHVWLSDDWYSPDGVPGLAVPFYMGHPRLAKLELNQMLEVEGGTPEWCMRILRHETGHAIENAYRLRRRRSRQKIFGHTSVPYPDCYLPKPYSKSFVLHLDMWYAPESSRRRFRRNIRVWLTPHSHWRERYAGWPALKKLEYMDGLYEGISGNSADRDHQGSSRSDPGGFKKPSGEHYKDKRERYGLDYPDFMIGTCGGYFPAIRINRRIRPQRILSGSFEKKFAGKSLNGPENISTPSIRFWKYDAHDAVNGICG